MTTTAYDFAAMLMTSDSRWSITIGGTKIAYVDDTGFDKIEVAAGHAFVFAGDSALIDAWKRYLRASAGKQIPALQGIALLAVNMSTNVVAVSYGQDIVLPTVANVHASFAGSGARHAAGCWEKNHCGRTAIETAKGLDVYTGGQTKFLELNNGSSNVTNSINVDQLGKQFLAKGMIMYINGQNAKSVAEAAANDAEVKEICDKIAQGSISLSAPCDAMMMAPTQEDVDRVQAAMDVIFKQ